MSKFDHVIVGGGSAGATLAARLCEDPARKVCLIEAGGRGDGILVRMPLGGVAMISGRPKINNWSFQTVPQSALGGRRGYQPRGKALGGSSAINAMLYVRGHRADYDGWAAAGCEGWGWDDVLPYFKRSERNARGADDVHGGEGPLQVTDQFAPRDISRAFVEACAEAQVAEVADFNAGDNRGAGLFQVTQFHDAAKRGERCSAAAAFLFPAIGRENLTVITGAQVTGLTFDGLRATGLRYRKGRRLETVAAGEVILSAGAFGSPQLLQLAGIGRPRDLEPHGIAVRHELPGVGQNLQDHLDVILTTRAKAKGTFGISPRGVVEALLDIRKWAKDGQSSAASPFAEGCAFFATETGAEVPDVQLHFVTAMVENHLRTIRFGHGYSCHVCALTPFSTGRVSLASADPLAPPMIDPNYLSDPRDLETLVRGVRKAQAIMDAAPLSPWRGKPVTPLNGVSSDTDIRAYIRATADTIYHPVGTCAMGQGAEAVVTPDLRVRGMEGLRVVDASVMPKIPRGNTNAPTIMIAEKAADLIAAE